MFGEASRQQSASFPDAAKFFVEESAGRRLDKLSMEVQTLASVFQQTLHPQKVWHPPLLLGAGADAMAWVFGDTLCVRFLGLRTFGCGAKMSC